MRGCRLMKSKRKRRALRPPLRVKSGDFQASRAVCRRSDLFADGPEPENGYDIQYASGKREGAIMLTAVNGTLNSQALALLVALCDLYSRKQYRIIKNKTTGETRRAITTTPKHLVEAIYGVKNDKPSNRYYEMLGLQRRQKSTGALDVLATVLIKRDSAWIGANGKPHRVLEAFHLVDSYRFHQIGNREYLQIFLSDGLQKELQRLSQNEQWALIPRRLVQKLGPKRQQALRVALHVLSHAPLPAQTGNGSRREIGITALVDVVRPDINRRPNRYPGRFKALVKRIVDSIDAVDADHSWTLAPATTDPLGKVICIENARKEGKEA